MPNVTDLLFVLIAVIQVETPRNKCAEKSRGFLLHCFWSLL